MSKAENGDKRVRNDMTVSPGLQNTHTENLPWAACRMVA